MNDRSLDKAKLLKFLKSCRDSCLRADSEWMHGKAAGFDLIIFCIEHNDFDVKRLLKKN